MLALAKLEHGMSLQRVDRLQIADTLVSFRAPTSLEADQYRKLRHIAEHFHSGASARVFGLTSAGPGEGKTMTTLNLAGSLAQSPDSRVLVIDADLHRPAVAAYLGVARQRWPGLAETVLRDGRTLADSAARIDALNISVLLAGAGSDEAYEILSSPRFDELIQEARGAYDYVLIDTPPVVPVVDCRLIARAVDGFFVVVAANKTPRKMFAEAMGLIEPQKIFGVVFNGDDRPLTAYSGYYGYREHRRPPGPAPRPGRRNTFGLF